MQIRALTTGDREDWDTTVRKVGGDIYHTAEYHRAYETDGERGLAICVSDDDGLLFHPVILRAIDNVAGEPVRGGLQDIETVYGYTGPLATTKDAAFLGKAWAAYDSWCQGKNVVSEFIRFNPLLACESYASPLCRVVSDRQTVAIKTDVTPDDLWRSYPSEQRNRLRKAQNAGVSVSQLNSGEGFEAFLPLYEETMRRLNAPSRYYFSRQYFQSLLEGLGARSVIYVARLAEVVIAAAMFLVGEKFLHYHLGGSSAAHQIHAPNNLLFHTAALDAGRSGLKLLHLGGGRTNAPGDDLLRFKKTFAEPAYTFHIGMRVHNQTAFDKLCSMWRGANPQGRGQKLFQLYRA